MTHSEFMTAIIEIYGKYDSGVLEKITFKYIREKFKESELQGVVEKLILVKSAKYKTPPDPAEFEEIFFKKSDSDYEIEALEWYKSLGRYSGSEDAIISDIRVQKCIENFGGWGEFQNRTTADEVFHQKKFVKEFVMYSRSRPEGSTIVMSGYGNYFDARPPQLIGDKEKCRLLLQEIKKESLQIVDNMVAGMKV